MSIREVISRVVSSIPGPCTLRGRVIHLALSGGVDSSVAGFLLRERGWDVRPVYMRCWADPDDAHSNNSCFEKELRAAKLTSKALGIERRLAVFDFVPEYWTDVFENVLLSGLAAGETPNPDLACNAFVKFGSFPARLAEENTSIDPPPFATGHYARIQYGPGPEKTRLLRAVDTLKDQTYFLASVSGRAFHNAIFPVGSLLKTEVRQIATYAGLPSAQQKSSRGICFIGKRRMSTFLMQYIDEFGKHGTAERGSFVLKDSDQSLCQLMMPAFAYTFGQKARIAGQPNTLYVVGRRGPDVLVSTSPLVVDQALCDKPSWVSQSVPLELELPNSSMKLQYKSCSTSVLRWCTISFQEDGQLGVMFESPQNAIAPGQAIVLYCGNEVLGAALVNRQSPYGDKSV